MVTNKLSHSWVVQCLHRAGSRGRLLRFKRVTANLDIKKQGHLLCLAGVWALACQARQESFQLGCGEFGGRARYGNQHLVNDTWGCVQPPAPRLTLTETIDTDAQVATGGFAWAVNDHQADALVRAHASLLKVSESADAELPLDFCTIDMRDALRAWKCDRGFSDRGDS
jgi:hypothetical protein